jgi:hypothetical protein
MTTSRRLFLCLACIGATASCGGGNGAAREAAAAPATAAASASYSTRFSASENPLSEGGRWVSPAPSVWNTTVRSENGAAFGDPLSAGFNDTVSVLTGSWPKDQTVTATVRRGTTTGGEEIELHLRLSYDASNIWTYEVDFTPSGVVVAKWRGPQGSYVNLPPTNGTSNAYAGGRRPQDGDVVEASITGDASMSTITVKLNGALILQSNDSVFISSSAAYTGGNPGIGFDVGKAGTFNQLGWALFSAAAK